MSGAVSIPAIETAYRGLRFRSRLEATWAAFFDRLGWYWSYEPFERDGWIPDFALSSGYGVCRPILVEVKPTTAMEGRYTQKIDRADQEHEALLVGCALPSWQKKVSIGWLRDENMEWASAPFGRWEGLVSGEGNPERKIGFGHSTGDFTDRITGCDDGPCFGSGGPVEAEVWRAWAGAKNTMQWLRGDQGAHLPRLDKEAVIQGFVNMEPDRYMLMDYELDDLVAAEENSADQKRMVSDYLAEGMITFQQARRQIALHPELRGA